MRKPLKPWSEDWLIAVEREKERLEDMTAAALFAEYGEREAMLIDEIVCDITFEHHIGPWIDCDHEEECWRPMFDEIAARELWWLHRQCDSNTRRLLDVWLMNTAEKAVAKRERDAREEYADLIAA